VPFRNVSRSGTQNSEPALLQYYYWFSEVTRIG
jgi:hypothetical protein